MINLYIGAVLDNNTYAFVISGNKKTSVLYTVYFTTFLVSFAPVSKPNHKFHGI